MHCSEVVYITRGYVGILGQCALSVWLALLSKQFFFAGSLLKLMCLSHSIAAKGSIQAVVCNFSCIHVFFR